MANGGREPRQCGIAAAVTLPAKGEGLRKRGTNVLTSPISTCLESAAKFAIERHRRHDWAYIS